MGLDVGVFTATWLPCPPGRPYEFAWHLAVIAAEHCGGEGNSFYWFSRDEIEDELQEWADAEVLRAEEVNDVRTWIASFPWEEDSIHLHFNW